MNYPLSFEALHSENLDWSMKDYLLLAQEEHKHETQKEVDAGLDKLKIIGLTYTKFCNILRHWVFMEKPFSEDEYAFAFQDYAQCYNRAPVSVKYWAHEIAYGKRTIAEHGHCLKVNLPDNKPKK